MKILALATACLAFAALSLVGAAPAAAATFTHFAAMPQLAADHFAHFTAVLSILAAAPAPRGIAGRVRADVSDPKAMIEQIGRAFEDFKAQNDARLKQIEGRGEDPITAEQVETINTTLSELQAAFETQQKELAAAKLNVGRDRLITDPEYTKDFHAFMRRGTISAAVDKTADADGGYLAPTEWDRTITDKLVLISPMRSICRVQSTGVTAFKKLFNLRGMASGWVGETAARPETNTPTFGELIYTSGELYANPAATQQMLDDSQINLESFIGEDVATEFARAEGSAFLSGDGANKPTGLLTYVTGAANAAVHPLGAIAVRAATGTAGTIDKADDLIDLIHDLPSQVAFDARFAMNRGTLGDIRKLKDQYGQYLWQPSYQLGQPQQLIGYPITELPDMPAVATGAIPVLFGDFADTYLILDRVGVRILRDPYTNKPYISFYTTKRVGGGLLNPEEMKALKIN